VAPNQVTSNTIENISILQQRNEDSMDICSVQCFPDVDG
jgi:hypothetical protein